MNLTEKRYVISRINSIKHEKTNEIYKEKKPSASLKSQISKTLKLKTFKEIKQEALDNVKKSSMPWRPNIAGAILFTEESVQAAQKLQSDSLLKRESRMKKINEEAQALSDEVMLGDSEVAIKMIEAFSKKKF